MSSVILAQGENIKEITREAVLYLRYCYWQEAENVLKCGLTDLKMATEVVGNLIFAYKTDKKNLLTFGAS